MNKNKLVLILTVVLLIVALSFVLTDKKSTLFGNDSDFAVKDTANIVKIFMADKNNQSVLLERTNEGWMLNQNEKAHLKNVEMLLTTIKNLEVKYPVPLKAHDNIVKVMAANSVKVEVYQNDYRIKLGQLKLFPYENKAKTIYVGNATQDNQGTFMLIDGGERPYVVTIPGFRGFVAARFTTDPKDWMSHEVFKVPYDQIAEIVVEAPADPSRNYHIRKLDKGYEIMSLSNRQILEAYDTVALYTFLDSFKNINFESIIDKISPERTDSVLHTQPIYKITVTKSNGEEQEITTFKIKMDYSKKDLIDGDEDMDRMYGYQNGRMLMVQYFVFDKITRPIEFFYPPQQ